MIIRGEGPKGGPGMPEMLTPTSAIMGAGLGKVLTPHSSLYAVYIAVPSLPPLPLLSLPPLPQGLLILKLS